MRRFAALSALVAAVATAAATGAAAPATYHYSVLGASATARLTYSGEPVKGRERTNGFASVTSRLQPGTARPRATLGSRGGRIAVKLSIRTVENAKISQRTSETTPYVEQNCAQTSTRKGAGGLVLLRLRGGRVQVGWAFPQANAVACPGPNGVAKSVAKRMVKIFTLGRFTQGRTTLKLSGSVRYARGAFTGLYRWSATVVLKRLAD